MNSRLLPLMCPKFNLLHPSVAIPNQLSQVRHKCKHKHPRFLARTVLVENNDVEEGIRIINRIMGREGLFEIVRLNQYYEKPFKTRRRINYEKAKAIYNEDMDRKIKFIMRKNRVDPWIGRI